MRKFGLIGLQLSHSFSKKYFDNKFKVEKIEHTQYELYELNTLDELIQLIEDNPQLLGLNVTLPYKEKVLPFMDELSPIAQTVGAVNTISIQRNSNKKAYLKGYNTDVIGFQESLKPFLKPQNKQALIFGTGGASKAIAYALNQLRITYRWVSRNPKNEKTLSYKAITGDLLSPHLLLINCTPLGMYPNIEGHPPFQLDLIQDTHLVYDLIYNPLETTLLKVSREKGAQSINGLSMLELQAEAAWKIWNNLR